MQYVEVYVRLRPASSSDALEDFLRHVTLPSFYIAGAVADCRLVEDKIIAEFHRKWGCDAYRRGEALLIVETDKSLRKVARKVRRIIRKNDNAHRPEPSNLNQTHYTI